MTYTFSHSGDAQANEVIRSIRTRLTALGSSLEGRDTGDHILNPGMGPYARAKGAPKDAAVLIPIIRDSEGPHVVLTQRTPHLSSHAGQIAFPGGKIDREDGSAERAALREAEEEIGLSSSDVQLVGRLSPYLTGSGYRIIPVVAELAERPLLRANPDEVDDIFEVPLPFLMDPANHQTQSLVWNGQRRYFYAMPYGKRHIWGVTAGIIRSLYDTVFA